MFQLLRTVRAVVEITAIVDAVNNVVGIYRKENPTKREIVDCMAQAIFAACQIAACGAVFYRAQHNVQVVFTCATGVADVARKVAHLLVKNEAAWTEREVTELFSTFVCRAGETVIISIKPHLLHYPACNAWLCEYKESIVSSTDIVGAINLAISSIFTWRKTSPCPMPRPQLPRKDGGGQQANSCFLSLYPSAEIAKTVAAFAANWQKSTSIPPELEALDVLNKNLPRCHLSGCLIRIVITCNDGKGGQLLFSKEKVEKWIAVHGVVRPPNVLNWPEGTDGAFINRFEENIYLQSNIDEILQEWSEIVLKL